MRTAPLIILLAASLAGCLGDSSTDAAPELPPEDRYPYEALVEYCTDNETCDFWDHQFHGYVVYDLDTTVIDAVIMPVPGVDPQSATAAAALATARWADVEQFAAPWFVDAFELNTYVVGVDVPSLDAVADPEIIVISESGQRSTSIGLSAEQIVCSVVGGARHMYPVHEHDGMAIYAGECVTGGFRCVALNFASALGGNNYLYDLVAHEVGHCLGAGHVGDALDFNARYVPTTDIMSYAVNPSQVPCASTLNARVLEGVFAHLVDRPEEEWLPAGSYYALDPWDYEQVDCPNPEPGFL